MTGAGIAYGAALALASVFAVAGVAKLRRRGSTARTFAALGLGWARPLSVGVPLVELALAGGLVLAPGWSGIVALAVLCGFSTFLVQARRRGHAVGCGCFGSVRPAPVGASELVRNGVLATAALVASFAPEPLVPRVGEFVVVVVGAIAASALVRTVSSRAPALAPPSGPQPGSPAPLLAGVRYEEHRLTLVAFVAPTCAGCDGLRAVVDSLVSPTIGGRVIDLDDGAVADFTAFAIRSTPFLVVVDAAGVVVAGGQATTEADVARIAGW